MNETKSVTLDQVKKYIFGTTVARMGHKTTVMLAVLENGFEICVSSSCVDAANYNEEIGRDLCMKKVEDKVWELLGFQLQTTLGATYANAA